VTDRAPPQPADPPAPSASWKRRAALAAAFAALCALVFAFVYQPGISSIFDDSVAYLTLARFFSGLDAPWAPHYMWFPPLFPLLLAAIGGGAHFARAHLFVAACALLSLPLVYRHAARRFGRADAAFFVVVCFELTATAWVSIKSILSEPAFLLFTMASLVFFEARLAATPRDRDRWLFGLLMGAALLTRVAGVFLLAAYLAHVGVRWLRRADRPGIGALIPLVPPVALALAWRLVRPMAGNDDYNRATATVLHGWLTRAPDVLGPAVKMLFDGWVASFVGGSGVAAITSIVLALLGVLALAGTVLRVRRNALDGWYVAIMLLAVLALYVNEDTTRRYLYPIVPLLLVNAGVALAALARRLPRPAGAAFAALAVGAPLLVCPGSYTHLTLPTTSLV
jgi:4-amino-4-deoxy-L-arabinose transferase-like glycosyltransferase